MQAGLGGPPNPKRSTPTRATLLTVQYLRWWTLLPERHTPEPFATLQICHMRSTPPQHIDRRLGSRGTPKGRVSTGQRHRHRSRTTQEREPLLVAPVRALKAQLAQRTCTGVQGTHSAPEATRRRCWAGTRMTEPVQGLRPQGAGRPAAGT